MEASGRIPVGKLMKKHQSVNISQGQTSKQHDTTMNLARAVQTKKVATFDDQLVVDEDAVQKEQKVKSRPKVVTFELDQPIALKLQKRSSLDNLTSPYNNFMQQEALQKNGPALSEAPSAHAVATALKDEEGKHTETNDLDKLNTLNSDVTYKSHLDNCK